MRKLLFFGLLQGFSFKFQDDDWELELNILPRYVKRGSNHHVAH